jgi:hypothetical protein
MVRNPVIEPIALCESALVILSCLCNLSLLQADIAKPDKSMGLQSFTLEPASDNNSPAKQALCRRHVAAAIEHSS